MSDLRQFGEFRLDAEKRVLWHGGEPVNLALKQIELLCVLTENGGEVVTKAELLDRVWQDSFVEESNLSRHIYMLRKAFKDLGQNEDLIKTVPRRGYRFTGEVRAISNGELVVEKRTHTRMQIEITEEIHPDLNVGPGFVARNRRYVAAISLTALAFASVGFGIWYAGAFSAPNPKIDSIAVLPFRILGGEQDHSGIGIADTLITRISAIKGLTVRPMNAVAAMSNLSAVEAGKKLNVDAILEGTIYRTDDQVRITARLIKRDNESIIWSGEFQKAVLDEITAQNELATHLVDVLAVNLSESERSNVLKSYTGSVEAYRLYERGRFEWNKRNTSGMIEAQRLFRNAVEKDPNFALAYSGLADTLATGSQWAEAGAAATRAIEIDPNLAEAHATSGFIKMLRNWDWDGAEDSFRRSVELNPGYASAHHWYATLLSIRGRNTEARTEMQRAIEIDPMSFNYLADMGQLYYFAGDYQRAEEFCNRSLALNPDFMLGHLYLHYIYLKTGRHSSAIDKVIAADTLNDTSINFARKAEYNKLRSEKIKRAYDENGLRGYLDLRYSGTPTDPEQFYLFAMKHALLGENDIALSYLERAAAARTLLTAFVKAEPIFEALRGEQRYKEILKRMDLAD